MAAYSAAVEVPSHLPKEEFDSSAPRFLHPGPSIDKKTLNKLDWGHFACIHFGTAYSEVTAGCGRKDDLRLCCLEFECISILSTWRSPGT